MREGEGVRLFPFFLAILVIPDNRDSALDACEVNMRLDHTLGRPTSYKPEYCEKLIEHMSKGLSYESFAAIADCCVKTLYNWERENPEFLHAKEYGEAKRRLIWEEEFRSQAFCLIEAGSQDGEKAPKKAVIANPSMMIFGMKNICGWRDKQDIDLSGSIAVTSLAKVLSEAD